MSLQIRLIICSTVVNGSSVSSGRFLTFSDNFFLTHVFGLFQNLTLRMMHLIRVTCV